MSELKKIHGIWHREVIRFWREKSRIISSLITPILWLLIFGTGMRVIEMPGIQNYQSFIFPGIVGMTLLFTSVWSGVSVIWDREFGFLKEILVAPVSRSSLVIGKALGGGTSALLQGFILLPLSPLVGIQLTPCSFLLLVPLMILISVGLVSIGLMIASFMESMEGFNLIMSLVVMPMFFLSGALFPLTSSPDWLKMLSYIDPLTYGVDALRWATFSGANPLLPAYIEILILVAFAVAMISLCSYTFSIKK
ncbi:MAG TPA: ABC transporter permease [Dehalococcoidia bacterium]|nr:ABC transporter permease [Dehalococcoidia bacterium]